MQCTGLATARHYQTKCGGDITEIQSYEKFATEAINPPDNGFDNATVSKSFTPQPK